MKYTVNDANTYISEHRTKIKKDFRLKYHMMPPVGWMNDPNGVVFFNKQYHVFYQYFPYNSVWGPMHWGHAVSDNLIDWTDLPVALAPDQAYENGCFSGGAIVKDNQLYLMYTSHVEGVQQTQTQSIAVSNDGIHFEKLEKNPVIGSLSIPHHASKRDFRDPNPVCINGTYYVLIGSTNENNVGQILVYKSSDLLNWEYLNVIGPNPIFGDMAECPDLFNLDGKDVILMSSQHLHSQNNKFKNCNSSIYLIGQFDPITGHFEIETYDEIDSGHDFYAPQTLLDDKNRRIMVAWMEMWGKQYYTHNENHGWVGALTLPRELKLVNNKLIQIPVSEIEEYLNPVTSIKNISLNESFRINCQIPTCCEIKFEGQVASKLNLKFESNEHDYFEIYVKDNTVFLDSCGSKLWPQEGRCNHLPVNQLTLQVFLDQSSVELFINGGQETITTRIYFNCENYQLTISGDSIIHHLFVSEYIRK